MPRGDGTGPVGMGPMTGRAAGLCAGHPVPGFMNPIPGRGPQGRGFGWGRGQGRGFGGAPFVGVPDAPVYGFPYAPEPDPKQETEALKGQAEYLEGALEDIRKRLAELEAEPTEKE